jgi:hypothetical protein
MFVEVWCRGMCLLAGMGSGKKDSMMCMVAGSKGLGEEVVDSMVGKCKMVVCCWEDGRGGDGWRDWWCG